MGIEVIGGTREDLESLLIGTPHYGIFHPMHLPEKAVAVIRDGSVIFYFEDKHGAIYGPSVGPDAIDMLMQDIRQRRPKAVWVSQLTEEQRQELKRHGARFRTRSKKYLSNLVGEFDLELKGRRYQKLRRDLRVAERAGLEFYEIGNKVATVLRLATLSEEFMRSRHIKVGRRKWVRERIKNHANLPNYTVYAVRSPGGKVLAAAGVGSYGTYAFMNFRINRQNPHRASEYLDFMIIKTLKEQGVKYMERGRVVGSKLRDYKAKFPPLVEEELHTTHTFDIPGVVRPPISWRVVRTGYVVAAAFLLFTLASIPSYLRIYYGVKDCRGRVLDMEEKYVLSKLRNMERKALDAALELTASKERGELTKDELKAKTIPYMSRIIRVGELREEMQREFQRTREEKGLPTFMTDRERYFAAH